jgi:hypothetical protein
VALVRLNGICIQRRLIDSGAKAIQYSTISIVDWYIASSSREEQTDFPPTLLRLKDGQMCKDAAILAARYGDVDSLKVVEHKRHPTPGSIDHGLLQDICAYISQGGSSIPDIVASTTHPPLGQRQGHPSPFDLTAQEKSINQGSRRQLKDRVRRVVVGASAVGLHCWQLEAIIAANEPTRLIEQATIGRLRPRQLCLAAEQVEIAWNRVWIVEADVIDPDDASRPDRLSWCGRLW